MKALNLPALTLAALLAVATSSPLAAQEPLKSGGAVVANQDKIWIVDDEGKVLAEVPVPGFPTVQVSPNGPTIIFSDQNGTRLYDRNGNQLGTEFKKSGTSQQVVVVDDTVVVIDDDKVRISDLKGTQQGQDIPKTGTRRQKVIVQDGRVIVVDDNKVRVFDKNGNPLGNPIPTNDTPDVIFNGKRLIIRDGTRVLILDKDGKLKKEFSPKHAGQWQIIDDERYVVLTDTEVQIYDGDGLERGAAFTKRGTGKQRVIVCGGKVIIIDDDQVRIVSREGQQLTGVDTKGRAEVKTTEDRIIITDDEGTRVFSKEDARLIVGAEVTALDRQYVLVASDRIVVTDADRTRIYDSDGSLMGQPIMRSGTETQRVYANGDRIGVVDTDKVRLFDLGGNQVGQDIAYVNDMEHGLQMFDHAFTVSDFDHVRIFDRDGAQQGNPINVSGGLQHIQVAGEQILVTHDNFFRIFLANGTQVGETQAVGFDPEVTPIAYRAGSFTPIGIECGEARQYALGNAAPGQEISHQLGNAPAGTLAQLNLGLSRTSWGGFTLPFDLEAFGAPGCTVYNDAVVGLGAAVSMEGFAQIEMPVPNDLNLVGFTFYSQWQVLAPGANMLGVLLSDGMETRIGAGF